MSFTLYATTHAAAHGHEDLLKKYHGNTGIVDGIVRDKEAHNQWEWNPDVKDLKMYVCWDSSATVTNDTQEKSQEVSQVSGLSAQYAAAALPGTEMHPPSLFSHSCNAPLERGGNLP